MCISGQISGNSLLLPTASTNECTSELKTLSDIELHLLDAVYQNMIPDYKRLNDLYQRTIEKARTHRTLSSMPHRSEWTPSGQLLSSEEREMLSGPVNTVIFKKKFSIECSKTGCIIEYTIKVNTSGQKPHQHCSSYVKFGKESSPPSVGCLAGFFEHVFSGLSSRFL